MTYKSTHMMAEENEVGMVAWLVRRVGDNQPYNDEEIWALAFKENPSAITAIPAMTQRATDEGVVEKLEDRWWLTKKGEGAYMAALGKKPKNSRFFKEMTNAQARKLKGAVAEAFGWTR